jgi:hypothetical protein
MKIGAIFYVIVRALVKELCRAQRTLSSLYRTCPDTNWGVALIYRRKVDY